MSQSQRAVKKADVKKMDIACTFAEASRERLLLEKERIENEKENARQTAKSSQATQTTLALIAQGKSAEEIKDFLMILGLF